MSFYLSILFFLLIRLGAVLLRLLKFQLSAFVVCLFMQRARRNRSIFAAHVCDDVVVVCGAVAAVIRYIESL